jgi:hypothetical protein
MQLLLLPQENSDSEITPLNCLPFVEHVPVVQELEDKKDEDMNAFDPGIPFNSRHTGVNATRFPAYLSAMKIFAELLTPKLVARIIQATNAFGDRHFRSAWKSLTVIVYMAIVRCDNRDDGIFKDAFVTSFFPNQERFNQIFYALHVRLDDDITPDERQKDCFTKLRNFVTELSALFATCNYWRADYCI